MRQTFTNINFINALLALSTIKRMLQRKPHTALTLKFQVAMYGKKKNNLTFANSLRHVFSLY